MMSKLCPYCNQCEKRLEVFYESDKMESLQIDRFQVNNEMDNELEIFLRGSLFKKLIEEKANVLQEKYELKKTELEILYYLSKSEKNNTSTDINRQLSMTKGHISQAVFHLVENGYLSAVTDHEDRRYIHYMLTEKAQDPVKEFSKMCEELNHQIVAGIPYDDFIVFERVAKQIWKNMKSIK